jgi:hypothetical protein
LDAALKKTTMRILAIVLLSIVAVGTYLKVDGNKKPFRCEFDSAKWTAAGLPASSDPETAFNRSLEDEGALASTDNWAVELNCSAQNPAIGRLFKRYLTASPKRWPLLALAVWGLSVSEKHESAANKAERFAKIFSLPDTESYFSKEVIVSATQKLAAGDIEYADALLAVTEQKLDETDRPKLRALFRSLEK